MIKFNEEIMKKVEEKEKKSNYIRRCLDARTCPDCGEILERHVTDDENFPDEVFQCSSCNFNYTRPFHYARSF